MEKKYTALKDFQDVTFTFDGETLFVEKAGSDEIIDMLRQVTEHVQKHGVEIMFSQYDDDTKAVLTRRVTDSDTEDFWRGFESLLRELGFVFQ